MTAPTLTAGLTDYTGTWTIDAAHSRLGFTARHAMVTKVRGQFDAVEGTFNLNGANPADSSASVIIQAASFSSGNSDRDAHVRSGDFLDVENFPTLTFASTAVRAKDDSFIVSGDLTIHGTTRSVDIEVEPLGVTADPFGNTRAGFEGSTTLSRKDFGLTWNVALEAGGVMVSDKIAITLDIAAILAV